MKCPKCNKEMIIMFKSNAKNMDSYTIEVIGRCEDCDFDAKWEETHVIDDVVIEHNLQKYYFC